MSEKSEKPDYNSEVCKIDDPSVLLKAVGIHKSFGGQSVLNNINFELHEGEIILLRGENGSGKTTLLNILTGNIEADKGILYYQTNNKPFRFVFPIPWWKKMNALNHFSPEFVAQKGITRTWQDIRLFNSQSLIENLTVAYNGLNGENPFYALVRQKKVKRQNIETQENATELLVNFGLKDVLMNIAGKISLGQSKRLAIARAIATGARILFMDEPFSGLDLNGIKSMIEFLRKLSFEKKMTIIIIEHFLNIPLVSSFATKEWNLKNGNLSISNIKLLDCERVFGSGINNKVENHYKFLLPPLAESSISQLPNDAILIRIRPIGFTESEAEVVLELRNLQIMRDSHIIEWKNSNGSIGLSLKVYRGEVILLQASNGWGKTTLVDTLIGDIPKLSGDIFFLRKKLDTFFNMHQLSKMGLQVIPASNNLVTNITGKEMLKLSKANNSINAIVPLLDKQINKLSGGQKQQIALATIQNIRNKHLLILDEPLSGLDDNSLSVFMHLFYPNPSYSKIFFLPSYF
jgi:branched-chain amino acid transport system ATP-binding protein